ncbi:transcription factor MYB1R1-like [Populus nigra]|uniref:transcription factor MYB1R1-like n=1 Tax=Populus nigra TaxID=3691 RepID=UPI002B27B0D7|nr:transcription factor MYB1R1-like [Populus nigra]
MVTGSSSTVSGGEGAAETKPKEIRLFGVRVVVDNFRRNVSLNDVTEYQYYKEMTPNTNNDNNNEEEDAGAAVSGYMSADDTVHRSSSASGRRSERKRGMPWTEEEHRRFLFGLQKVGKGDWRGISRNFVKTRNPTQVASHAQKHFLRLNNVNRRRRRTSLFDITADTLTSLPKEEQQAHRQDSNINNHASPSNPLPPPPLQANSITNFSGVPSTPIRTVNPSVLPLQIENPMMESQSLGQGHQFINHSTNLVRPVAVVPAVCTPAMPDLNLNLKPTADSSSLSLKLSSPFVQRESTSRSSAFQAMSSMKNGDNIITVA